MGVTPNEAITLNPFSHFLPFYKLGNTMMLLVLIAVAAASATRAAAMEQHCLDPVDCPFYPVHSCFATERGLICQNRSKVSSPLYCCCQ